MIVLRIACVGLLSLGIGACRGDAEDRTADFTPLPRGEAATASTALVDADIDGTIESTRDVLARAGVQVASERQVLGFAFDARRKGTQMRLDSAEFAQMLKAFGFDFEGRRQRHPDSERGMNASLDKEDRPELERMRLAERREAEDVRTATRAEEDALRERQAAQRQALRDGAREREAAARAARDAVSQARRRAPRGEQAAFDARMAAAHTEIDEARLHRDAVQREIRALERRHEAELRDIAAAATLERRADEFVGRDHAAGRQLMALLGEWVRQAQSDPGHPDSFAPLFLAEMARRQADPVDLAADPDPVSHRWSLLEMAVFASAFRPAAAGAPRSGPGPLALIGSLSLLVPSVRADSPCEVARDAWGNWGDVAQTGNANIVNTLLTRTFEAEYGTKGAQKIMGGIAAMSIVSKVVNLAAFYSQSQVTVEGEVSALHKPVGSHQKVAFTARAGVSPEELEAYRQAVEAARDVQMDQALRDCLGWGGLPAYDTIADVAKDADNWLLDWRLEGHGHANWSLRDNERPRYLGWGRAAMKMKRVSPSSLESRFVIRVLEESAHKGPLGTGKVVVSAEVDSSSLPSLGTLVNAVGKTFGLGLVESLVDIAAGWTRVVFKPRAYAVLDLDFHCPHPTTIHRYVKNPVADGIGQSGEACTFTFDTPEEYKEWRDEQGL